MRKRERGGDILEGDLLAISVNDGEGQDTAASVGVGVDGPVGNDLLLTQVRKSIKYD